MKNEKTTLSDVLIAVLVVVALGLGFAYAA